MIAVRPARLNDRQAILEIWHQGWHEAHARLVPTALLAFRTPEYFSRWLDQCTDKFHVAEDDGALSGFVSVKDCEIVKLYVAPDARGAGVARALLSHAERLLAAQGIEEAALFCLAGNFRAERFYARQGWRISETIQDALWLPAGITGAFRVETHQFTKRLTGIADQ